MRSIIEEIVKTVSCEIQQQKKVVSVKKESDHLKVLMVDGSFVMCKNVVITSPVAQSLDMVKDLKFEEKEELEKVKYAKTISLQVAMKEKSRIPTPGAIQKPIESIHIICDNKQKGISTKHAVTIHCDPKFSDDHFESSEEEIERIVLEKTEELVPKESVLSVSIQRWRYAAPTVLFPQRHLLVEMGDHCNIVFCGDAFKEARVEGAVLSGMSAGNALKSKLKKSNL